MKGAWLPIRRFYWTNEGNSETYDSRLYVQVGDGYVDFLDSRRPDANATSVRLADLLGAIARAER